MSGSVSITEHDGAVQIEVRVKPRASRARVVGVRDGAVEIALTAPPVDGAANDALVAFVAAACGVAKRAVTIVRGEKSRQKLVRVAGVTADALLAALQGTRPLSGPGARRFAPARRGGTRPIGGA